MTLRQKMMGLIPGAFFNMCDTVLPSAPVPRLGMFVVCFHFGSVGVTYGSVGVTYGSVGVTYGSVLSVLLVWFGSKDWNVGLSSDHDDPTSVYDGMLISSFRPCVFCCCCSHCGCLDLSSRPQGHKKALTGESFDLSYQQC